MIKNDIGIDQARAALVLLVVEVTNFFNVGKTMNDIQVAATCDLIIDTYSYLKLDDFKLCFKKGMLGEYGKIYDRMDGAVILGWIREYNLCRDEAAIRDEETKKRNNLDSGVFYEDYINNLKNRADNGDTEAIEALSHHKETESLLKKIEPEYNSYKQTREYKRLHG